MPTLFQICLSIFLVSLHAFVCTALLNTDFSDFWQARKTFFGAREVQHRSERAVRGKVLRPETWLFINPNHVCGFLFESSVLDHLDLFAQGAHLTC